MVHENLQKSYNNVLFFDYDIENASTRILFNEKIYKLPHISQEDRQTLIQIAHMYDKCDKMEEILNFLSRENLIKLRSRYPISSLIISDIIGLFLMLQVGDCLDELFKYKNYIKYTSTELDIHLYLDFNGFEIHLPNLKDYQSNIIAISELKDLDQELVKMKTITDLEGLS